jgi:hypothetical protein
MAIMPPVDLLLTELRGVFGDRLETLLTFGSHASTPDQTGVSSPAASGRLLHTLAVVDAVTFVDLAACASLSAGWLRRGLATPLILGADELRRSFDAFPLELAEIVATRRVIAGKDPLAAAVIKPEDLRQACEVQARSHLLHLREGYIEAAARTSAVAALVTSSAAPFKALLCNVARLEGADCAESSALAAYAATLGLPASVLERLQASGSSAAIKRADAGRLYTDCLDAAERLARYVDQWAC